MDESEMANSAFAAQEQVNGLVEQAFPQGCWLDEDYLWLTDRIRRPVELTDGYLEILPLPTRAHQRILAFLYSAFQGFLETRGGEALFAPVRLRVRRGKFREPDLLAVRDARDSRSGDRFWTGADVVLEVVSADNPTRDLVHKRQDYAEASIPEYWIGSLIQRLRPSACFGWARTVTSNTPPTGEGAGPSRWSYRVSRLMSARCSMPGWAGNAPSRPPISD